MGGLIVAVVDDVMLRCMAGRRLSRLSAWTGVGEKGESSDKLSLLDDFAVPSYCDGEVILEVAGSSGAALGCLECVCVGICVCSGSGVASGLRRGDLGGSSTGLFRLSLLNLRDGAETMLRLLVGRANGLVGRSAAAWLIWLGRRVNGFAFSGDSELVLVGERCEGAFVGDDDGVAVRMAVAGDWLFCLRKGDCLPEEDSKGDSWAESLLGFGEAMSVLYSVQWSVCGCERAPTKIKLDWSVSVYFVSSEARPSNTQARIKLSATG